ncbi:MAG: hypothetical protein MK329_12880 [Pirellulales bacterium]|jgi:hypothetical protein|nr:hypothetical protein [Pirellulales bacterium]
MRNPLLALNKLAVIRLATARLLALLMAIVLTTANHQVQAQQQQRNLHYRNSTINMAPGMIGQSQLYRGGPLPGYFQPVEIITPVGTKVGFAFNQQFEMPKMDARKAGMLIGHTYRLKVTNIYKHPGEELYPTVEVIDRLYPPRGKEFQYPIPIHIDQQDIESALAGFFVTRVIYVEAPATALQVQDRRDYQRVTDVGAQEDPLRTADRFGRPVAILRIGSRLPVHDPSTGKLRVQTPPLLLLQKPGAATPAEINQTQPGRPTR